MLGQALKAYRFQRDDQRASPTQQRFASHTAPSAQQRFLTHTGTVTGVQGERSLRPSAATALNRFGTQPISSDNSLKRKATDSFESSMNPSLRGAERGGVLNKLHSGVFFDENDFVDDADIDLDEESPLNLPNLPPNHLQQPTTTPTPARAGPAPKQDPPSFHTSQLDWSSSPIDHLRAPTTVARSAAFNLSPAPIIIEDDEPTQPAKRRKLPWQTSSRSLPLAHNAIPLSSSIIPSVVDVPHNDPVKYPTLPQATPLSKSNTTDLPWNKTASALKEDQRRLRQQQAQQSANSIDAVTGISNNDGNDGARTAMEAPARMELSAEQLHVLRLITYNKKSVFFTGSAGTGKSVLMREIIQVLKKNFRRDSDRVAVTASTGLAATNIGGVTLHSFSGIGLGKDSVEVLVKRIKKNPKAKGRWLRTKVLIIDEISMVDGELFDKLEEIARILRKNGRPFGGIQLVVTGDFFQLPPVPDRNKVAKFAFDAATWSTSIQHTIGLTHIFRQKDPEFAAMLNEMRLGRLAPQSITKFHALSRKPVYNDNIEPTELFPTRQEVERSNNARMQALPGGSVDYFALDGGTMTDITRRTELLQNCMAPEKLSLKIDAQVMLIKNIDETLVNGSIGKIIKFMDENTYEYMYEHGEDFTGAEPGDQVGDPLKAKFKAAAFRPGPSQKFPLVQFKLPDGTIRELLLVRESWKVEQPNGEVIASRSQVPLIPAWALSIHKAQGQTLPRVKVDLGKIFERGQAYVALSRATSQHGLQILRFDPKKVMAHEKVRTFYDGLANVGVSKSDGADMSSLSTKPPPPMGDDSLFLDEYDDEAFLSHTAVRE